ncbi:hypothetical protein ABMA28_015808 [Loxostege sticticalis]|uniref:TIL domain-containing protein n=1 Tax=Loxostege sticticalis TaxID=481309 RepID=A0ABD0TB47_LOXSC
MTRLVLIFFCSCVIIGSLADPECSENESVSNCPVNSSPECGEDEILDNCSVDSSADYCPKSEEEAMQARPPTPNPCPKKPACKCRFNYRYASRKNKTCIPTSECPPFKCKGLNDEFNPCPPLCPTDSCSQATPDGQCPKQFGRIGIVLECEPKCRCIKNYWKLNGVCVPYAQCPQNQAPEAEDTTNTETPETRSSDPQPATQAEPDSTPQGDTTDSEYEPSRSVAWATASASDESSEVCGSPTEESEEKRCSGPNEVYVLEKQTCPPELCFAITARLDCRNEPPRKPGCACKSGYYRLNETSPCMHICKCPQMANSPDCA